jgi:hypothetical protein
LATYGHDPVTGSVFNIETSVIMNDRATFHIYFPDGTKTNMPIKRAAYILAFRKAPIGYVRTRRGTTGLALANLIEERYTRPYPSVEETA